MFQPPTLLQKILFPEKWFEHRVQIHGHEIIVILLVAGGERIQRVVWPRHRVHEGGQRPVQHLHEGVPHGELVAAAERGVLQDVRHARGVSGRGPEVDTECLVGVLAAHVQVAGPRLLVLQQHRADVEVRHPPPLHHSPSRIVVTLTAAVVHLTAAEIFGPQFPLPGPGPG